jgi:hemerythrin-like metal-binding protein
MTATPERILERLDADHQDLFKQLSELRSALKAGIRSEVATTLSFVRQYAESHFAAEEREMLASGYPHFHVHRAAHGRLGREVRALEAEWAKNGVTPVLAESVLEALSEWFEVHIMELDAQLVRHLRVRGVRPPAVGWPTNVVRLPRYANH